MIKSAANVPREIFMPLVGVARHRRGGEFDLDCDRLAVVPLTETVQAIGKIFERR